MEQASQRIHEKDSAAVGNERYADQHPCSIKRETRGECLHINELFFVAAAVDSVSSPDGAETHLANSPAIFRRAESVNNSWD